MVAMTLLIVRWNRVAKQCGCLQRRSLRLTSLRWRKIRRSWSIWTLRLNFEGMTGVVPSVISHEHRALLYLPLSATRRP